MHTALLLTFALGATFEPDNLKGLTSMRIIVENVPGAEKVGLDPSSVQADIESTLRKGGIKVTQIAGILPYLYVQMSVLPLPDGCVAYSLHFSLKTGADIISSKKLVMADLWSDGILSARCTTGKKDKTEVATYIRQSVIDEANKMVNDIVAANRNG